jgi:hypothetical protein
MSRPQWQQKGLGPFRFSRGARAGSPSRPGFKLSRRISQLLYFVASIAHLPLSSASFHLMDPSSPAHPALAKFDLLSTNALELRDRLQNGTLTSVEIVTAYLAQIKRYNSKLHLVVSLRQHDQLLADARQRDEERKAGNVRSPFHGLPFLAKDAYATVPSLGLQTTVGSFALKDSKPRANAAAIDAVCKLPFTGLAWGSRRDLTH